MSNKKTLILSDSTCDLSAEITAERNIKISPLTVVLGDEAHRDGVDITPDDVYAYYKTSGNLAKTTATNMAEHEDFINTHVKADDEAVWNGEHLNVHPVGTGQTTDRVLHTADFRAADQKLFTDIDRTSQYLLICYFCFHVFPACSSAITF